MSTTESFDYKLHYINATPFLKSSTTAKSGADQAHDQLLDFDDSAVAEVSIPDSVRELRDDCFRRCNRLRRVLFGCSSSLGRIGDSCFVFSDVEDVSIPDGVRELCDHCFYDCESLRGVNFCSSSSLEQIGFWAFPGSGSYLCEPVFVT